MKTTSVLYQLFLEQVNSYSAIALSLCLAIVSTPAMAQDNTIQLQDADSSESPTQRQEINYRELPELEGRELPKIDPAQNITPIPAENIEFATEETDYTLGAGDQINLNIFQVEEYSGEYPVLVDGTISLPLVGRVDVRGLSLKETSDVVSKEYSTYLKRPIITVGLVAPRPLKIGIAGEVDNPGSYEVVLTADNPQFPTVTDLIQQSGGINTIADVRNVRVTREIKGKEIVYNANLWNLLTKNQIKQDISLRDGDTIFVPTTDEINTAELNRLAEASFGLQTDKPIQVAIVGEVYRPGSHFVQPELLSRDNNNGANQNRQESIPPRLTQAIGAANGIKPLANVREVEVRRTAWDGAEKVIAVNMWELIKSGDTSQDLILQEGDKIIIPKADKIAKEDSDLIASGTISPGEITVNVVGEVGTPGPVQVKPNTPLNQAILAAGGFDNQRANSNQVELVSLKPDGTVEKRQIEVDLASGIDEETNPTLNQNDVVIVGRSGSTAASDGLGKITNPLGGLLGILNFIF
ncbi:MAG: SLBB domain-containing protein [Pleurocapsa sp. MO_192.B19]|nr:SLBB domain-containing protein [Pleurocapsa sp. MO_192.B19]